MLVRQDPAGRGGAQLARHRGELSTLRPAELADLLEDLGRRERHELLDLVGPGPAADALEEMDPGELHQLLTQTSRCRLDRAGTGLRCAFQAASSGQ